MLEISKHFFLTCLICKEGLAQLYAHSLLSSSMFLFRQGVFMEYCRHKLCGCGDELNYGNLKLAVPISNFVSHCEAIWMKSLSEWSSRSDSTGVCTHSSSFLCNGRSYYYPMKRIMRSDDLGLVLIGNIKVDPVSGRLQLIDATGSIDVLIPHLPSSWSSNSIYKIDDFAVVMEGIPINVCHLQSPLNDSFSCRSIFNGIPFSRQITLSLYLYFCLGNKQDRNRLLYPCAALKETVKEFEDGRFHLLLVTHKFPVLQKFQGINVGSRTGKFAEAIIMPWELVISCKDRALSSKMMSISDDRKCWKFIAHKRQKVDQASKGFECIDFNELDYQLFDHINCCSSAHGNLSYPLEIPCFAIANDCSFTHHGMLRYTQDSVKVGSDFKSVTCKVLLEYQSDSTFNFELLKIGGYYLLKHFEEDTICTFRKCNDFSGRKLVMTRDMCLWKVSFYIDEYGLHNNPPDMAPPWDSVVINTCVLARESQQAEFPFLRFKNDLPGICSDIDLYLSADFISYIKDNSQMPEGIQKTPFGVMDTVNSTQCNTSFTNASVQFPNSDTFTEGSLVSLKGHVLTVHNFDCSSSAGHLNQKCFATFLPPGFIQGSKTRGACIHVLVDHQIVRILGSSAAYAYPTGFGIGANVNFHRVLGLGGQNEFALTSASFIVIHSVRISNEDNRSEPHPQEYAFSDTAPGVLISDAIQRSVCKFMEFHCRMVSVYFVVLEKARHPYTEAQSTMPPFSIPVAGFIMDDGSSSYCCWTDNERAVTLLRLREVLSHMVCKNYHGSSSKMEIKGQCSSIINRIDEILEQHKKIVIKNDGSMFDFSYQDPTFSVGSDKGLSASDGDLFKFILFYACFGTTQKIVGSLMNSNAISNLETCLTKLGMTMHHPLQNIWATAVSSRNPVAESRNIIEELLDS